MRKSLGFTGVVLGLVLMLGAALFRWVIAPDRAVLPSDTDVTRTYAGTAATVFDPTAITSGGQLFLHGVPITVTHHTKVLSATGDNARVSDSRTVTAGGKAIAAVEYVYAVDRTSMQRGGGYADVAKQNGITFNWPIRTQKHDYTGWVADTHRTVALTYRGTATRGGESVYVFTARTAAAPIVDQQVLRGLPTSIPKATLGALAAHLPLTTAQKAGLLQLLPALPDPVQFGYSYQATATYWVAPASGIVVDAAEHQVRTLLLQTGTSAMPVTTVLDMSFVGTPATVQAAAKDASDKGNSITLVYTTLPLTALITGAVLFLAGGALLTLRRRTMPPAQPPTTRPRHAPTVSHV
jgi:hypothetical protein